MMRGYKKPLTIICSVYSGCARRAVTAKMEAASGFEPLNDSFADCSLNHLGTPPMSKPNLKSLDQ